MSNIICGISPSPVLFEKKKYNENINILIYLNIFKNVIYSIDGKADFSSSLLKSSVSHDPSEINSNTDLVK